LGARQPGGPVSRSQLVLIRGGHFGQSTATTSTDPEEPSPSTIIPIFMSSRLALMIKYTQLIGRTLQALVGNLWWSIQVSKTKSFWCPWLCILHRFGGPNPGCGAHKKIPCWLQGILVEAKHLNHSFHPGNWTDLNPPRFLES